MRAMIGSKGSLTVAATYLGKPAVVKMSWLTNPVDREILHLQEAANVPNVTTLKAYAVIYQTRDLRSSLDFSESTRYNYWATVNSDRNHGLTRPLEPESDPALPLFYHERTLVCIVLTPIGEPLSKFSSWDELCKLMLDGIIAHKSLCLDKGILHRDISAGNLLIWRRKHEVGGRLIDLDHATKLRDNWLTDVRTAASTKPPRTGTKMYMAIEVLQGIYHTYRHDLESFFYVLLHMCFERSKRLFESESNDQKAESIKDMLGSWERGSFAASATSKAVFGYERGLAERMRDFFHHDVESLKTLCEKFRMVLFHQDGFPGTPVNPERLYDDIIEIFRDYVP